MTTVGDHLQAAIRPIKSNDSPTVRRSSNRDLTRKTADTHAGLWKYYDNIPEVHYWVNVTSGIARMLHYYPATVPNDADVLDPEPDDDPAVLALWDDIGGETALREWVAELTAHRRVVGEAYFVPRNPKTGELVDIENDDPELADAGTVEWDVVSSVELRRLMGAESGAQIDVDAPAWRVWKRHPFDAERSDPPLGAVRSQCEALLALDGRVLADSRARLSAGILFVPDSLLSVRTESGRPFDDELDDMILQPIQNPDSTDAVAPMVAYIRSEEAAAIRHVTFGRENTPDHIAQREELVRRIAAGLDAPAELLLGMGDLNHWSAWLIQDSTYTQHIDPDVVDVLDDLSVWWRSLLQSAGIDPEGRVLWRDPNPAMRRPDRLADTIAAYDRYAASGDALRDAAGLDDSDIPSDDEIERRIRIAQLSTPFALAQGAGSDINADPPPPADDGPPASDNPSDGDTTPPPPASHRPRLAVLLAAADERRLERLANALSVLDRTTLSALETEANRQMRRARARAINRITNEARNLPAYAGMDPARLYDRLSADEIRALIGDAGGVDPTDFDADTIERLLADAETERQTVLADAGVTPSDAGVADDRRNAIAVIIAALIAGTIASVLRSPIDPDTPPGETPAGDVVVPIRTIRDGMTIAGGDIPATVAPTVGAPTDGIGNGARTIDDLARAGLTTAAYRWVYGDIPRQTFRPHLDMDDAVFVDFDDPVLAPPPGAEWLGSRMFPGDHRGCRCTYRRLLVEATTAA